MSRETTILGRKGKLVGAYAPEVQFMWVFTNICTYTIFLAYVGNRFLR